MPDAIIDFRPGEALRPTNSIDHAARSRASEPKGPIPSASKSNTDPHSGFREALRRSLQGLADGEAQMAHALRQAQRSSVLRPETLLALQAGVYRHTMEVELASKLVDKTTGALRQTLQSQQ